MKAETFTVLAIVFKMCNLKYHLIQTRGGSHNKSDTRDVEYGYNYDDYYTDYPAGMHLVYCLYDSYDKKFKELCTKFSYCLKKCPFFP